MGVIVVGAGVAGLACATALADAGVPVRVLERGRVVGGRLASKRIDGRRVDIGAAYFTADDPAFAALVARWRAAGLTRPWTRTMRAYDMAAADGPAPDGTARPGTAQHGTALDGTARPGTAQHGTGRHGCAVRDSTGPVRWAAGGGLRSLAEDLAGGLDVSLAHPVTAVGPGPVVDGEPADAVVLAMPGPQALRLLGAHRDLDGLAAVARAQQWSPVLAAVLRYPERAWSSFAGAFVNGHPLLAGVSDDGDRRGDGAPVLVAHSTGELAARHLGDPAAAGPLLERATRDLLGLSVPAASVHVHRWTYAQPQQAGPPAGPPYHLAEGRLTGGRPAGGVALAGDAFGRPRVQTAWLSGHSLGRDLGRELAGQPGRTAR